MTPRTPQKGKLPLFFALRAVSVKAGGGARHNPWIYAIWLYKSLIVEQNFIAGCPLFSTGCIKKSTGYTFFSTGLFFGFFAALYLYLSLLKEERREEEGLISGEANPRVSGAAYFLIHGLAPSSTGNPWISVDIKSLILNVIVLIKDQSTHPRVVLPLGNFGLFRKGVLCSS